MSPPRIFLDITMGTNPLGRLVLELYDDKTPKTCENFRQLCTGEKPPLTYKMTPFHRIIDEFMVQGGDITKGDGTGGKSIYGGEFADENLGWRAIDEEGLLCMANRGKGTNSSQFFITLAPCEHLNAKHTVFGHLVSGEETLERMAAVKVDKEDRPIEDVIISHCGELERRKKAKQLASEDHEMASSTSRGRHTRRHPSLSKSRSPSPSRGHTRESASRHRHKHHRHRRDESASTEVDRDPTPPVKDRRRSDASPDHTFRGRERRRHRSRSPFPENEGSPASKHYRKRSPPPSRPRSVENEDGERRQRSLPNQYRDWRNEGRRGRDGGRRNEDAGGRLGGGGAWRADEAAGGDGVVYKGRGAMKYREQNKKRW